MSGPAVSVCIPAYRRPRELREAILSVLNQTFQNFEIVVGDDSGDLEEAVLGIGDPRLRYLRNQHRLGMAGNWTNTLDSAQGRYRALLMDDDRLLPGFLKSTVEVLEEDASVGVAFTNHYLERGLDRTIRVCPISVGRHDSFLRTLLVHKPVAVSAALMRATAWVDARPLPDLYTADIVMYLRMAAAGWAFHYIDEPLMTYRVHVGQLSTEEKRCRHDLVRAWELFEFSDIECERLRRRLLSSALLGRAATHLKAGELSEAESDCLIARSLSRPQGGRELIIAALAGHPRFRALALRSWRALHDLRRR